MTVRQIRNSEIYAFKACRLAWYWGYELHLQPLDLVPALSFGELAHRALELYYIPGRKRGPHPALTFGQLYEEHLETHSPFGVRMGKQWVEADELGIAMLNHYIEHYGDDEHIEIISPEMVFRVTLLHPKTKRKYVQPVGKLDAVYRNLLTGKIGLIDHKTAASIQTDHLTLDEQAGHYFAFAPRFLRKMGYLDRNVRISHILYNFLRKALPDTRPKNDKGQYLNKDSSVSKTQPPSYFHREPVWRGPEDRKSITQRVLSTHYEMQLVREGKLDIIKRPSRDCPRCPFKDPCELHEAGSDWEEMLKLNYQDWEPYSDYEIARKG